MDTRRFISLVLALVMVLGLCACTDTPDPTTEPTTEPTTTPTTQPTTAPTEPTPPPTEPEPTPPELYALAVEALNSQATLQYWVSIDRTVQIGSEKFTEGSDMDITLQNIGSASFRASVKEQSDIDGYTTEYDDIFVAGLVYTTVDSEYHFTGNMTADDFLSRLVPAVVLDASLYAEPTLEGGTLIFTDATAGESWLMPEYAEFVKASGTAVIGDDRALAEYTYTLAYRIGGAEITYDIHTKIGTPTEATIEAPADADTYTYLDFVDAPRMMESVVGLLFQAEASHSVTSTVAESIVSYAAGLVRNQSTTLNSFGNGKGYLADVDTSLYLNQMGETISYEQNEHFENGVYTYSADGSDPQENRGVTSVVFQNYVETTLVNNIPDYTVLLDAKAEDLGSVYYLELTLDESVALAFQSNICTMLWEDPEFLNDLSTGYRTDKLEAYLAIDKYTGLPTAVGYYYEGYHTIQGADYMLSLQTDQSFDLSSQTAYETITEKAPVAAKPAQTATPLFYHVTGPEGQEMWLLGTIHVGDARTSYLPQEIYDAFDSADALAVEFNSEAFDQAMEDDEGLSEQVSGCYFFDDGTTTENHIKDAELYDYALKLVKATGNYHMNAPYLKAYFWSSGIENFFLRQGHDLSSIQGVDNQLIWRAEDQGKTILDVESGLFQIQMLSGFSDGLQELLLLEACATDPLEYINDTKELFEMWCAGDEAALIAYLNEEGDTSELTDEELAYLEEYNNAMGTDRNDDMHDVAVSYLEGDQVVFFAVGLAHLLAEDGLVNTLRDAGYTVELVPYA